MIRLKSPKVSVLTPLYNTNPHHLREAIESILSQTFTDFEYLIVNDSPDNTDLDRLVASYGDPRIRYYKNEVNLGIEGSTNRLIEESRGEYIAIFDHDDISMPHRLEREVEFLDGNPGVGVVSAQFRLFGMQNFDTSNPLDSVGIRATLLTASCVSHTTAMFRKSVLIDNNIRYEKEFFPASSYRIITRLALVTDIVNLPDALLRYRIDGNNTSLKNAARRADARTRIGNEYGAELVKRAWQQQGHSLKVVDLLGVSPHSKTSRYYRATGREGALFIKAEAKGLANEYRMTRRMFELSGKYFLEPVDFFRDEYDYLSLQWSEGVNLDEFLSKNTLTKKQKSSFIKDLHGIFKLLREAGVVHRDITPSNILVVKGRLKLIDFHFAVDYDNYQELKFVRENIGEVDMMGAPFAAGVLKWDDAFSIVRIAEHIAGDDAIERYAEVKYIADYIDDRVIIPDGAILREVILAQRSAIKDKDAALARFDIVRKTALYRAARKMYRVVRSLYRR